MSDQLRRVSLRVSSVVCMIFILGCSGAFGLEDMVSSSGPGMTLLLLLVLPVIWALPMTLICAELGSALPGEGGYYVWVRRALGRFWGFQAGWWSWTCSWVDSAVYVALTVAYIRSWVSLSGLEAWLLGVAIIALFAYMNIRGVNVIAFSSVVSVIVIMAPFVGVVVLSLLHWNQNPLVPFLVPGQSLADSLGLGLAIGMWMYSGYDSMSVMAGEVESPQRVIPRALLIAMPLIVLAYVLPVLAGLASVGDWANWTTEGGVSFVEIAKSLGGPVLATAMLASALVSNAALYMDYLASGSRPAYALAADNLLPKVLTRTHKRYGTPWVSIVLLAAINSVLTIGTFSQLVVIDVFLNMFYYILIFVAGVVLRFREPDLPRPFRIPLNTVGVLLMSLPPIAIAGLALFTNGTAYIIGGALGAASGPIAYAVFVRLCDPSRASLREA